MVRVKAKPIHEWLIGSVCMEEGWNRASVQESIFADCSGTLRKKAVDNRKESTYHLLCSTMGEVRAHSPVLRLW